MIYVLIAVNILTLVTLGTFIGYALGKGMITINKHQVMDKETSIKLAEKIEEEMKAGGEY